MGGSTKRIGTAPQETDPLRHGITDWLQNQGYGSIFAGGPPGSDNQFQTQSVDQLGGANSDFFKNMMGQLQPAFQQQREMGQASARESAGSLTGSGFANRLGSAMNRSLGEEQGRLADYAKSGLEMETQRQGADANRAQQLAMGNADNYLKMLGAGAGGFQGREDEVLRSPGAEALLPGLGAGLGGWLGGGGGGGGGGILGQLMGGAQGGTGMLGQLMGQTGDKGNILQQLMSRGGLMNLGNSMLGQGGIGALTGRATGGSGLGGAVGGLAGGKLLGGALGSFLGPFGTMAGSAIGGAVARPVSRAVRGIGRGIRKIFSDEELKQNIRPMGDGLGTVRNLNPVRFNYRGGGGDQLGFVAQDMAGSIPEAVERDSGSGYLTIRPDFVIPHLVTAIQQMDARTR